MPLYKTHVDLTMPDLSSITWRANQKNDISEDQWVLDRAEFRDLWTVAMDASCEYVYGVLAVEEQLPLTITSSWLNRSQPGASHHRHWHPNNLASGVMYLHSPEDSGGAIVWLSDAKPRVNLPRRESTLWNTKQWMETPVTGDILIFPSEVDHWVEPYTGQEPRISLAWNVAVEGQYSADINR